MSRQKGMETEVLAKLVIVFVVLAVILLFVIRSYGDMNRKYNNTSSQVSGEASKVGNYVGDLGDLFSGALSGLAHYSGPVVTGNCEITELGGADCGLKLKYGTDITGWQPIQDDICKFTYGCRPEGVCRWCKGSFVGGHCKVNMLYCRPGISPALSSEYDFTMEEIPCKFKIIDTVNCKSEITVGDICTGTTGAIAAGGTDTKCKCKLTRKNPSPTCVAGDLSIVPAPT